MKPGDRVTEGVYVVGGPEATDPRDCLCYLVAGSRKTALIDCGTGPSVERLLENCRRVGPDSDRPIDLLILTHAHIDHVGGAAFLKKETGCRVLIHPLEAGVLAQGERRRSAADWYGVPFPPCQADGDLSDGLVIPLGGVDLTVIHIPGHTPGSVALSAQIADQTVLFGQDIHGPFDPDFESDIDQWSRSMYRLLDLRPEILAEGHFGIFQPAAEIDRFIRSHLAAHGFFDSLR